MGIFDKAKSIWNAFSNRDPTYRTSGEGSYYRPDSYRPRFGGSQKSIATPVFNRIALDVAAIEVKHVRLDKKKRYLKDEDSSLNDCLTLSANIDQTPRAFLQDYCLTLFDEGHAAIIPTRLDEKPLKVEAMRVGVVKKWMPQHVTVECYNSMTGVRNEITLPKELVLIVQNPFYTVMNEHNSTLQRLLRKLSLLDIVDEQSSSGKLDMIIQLPYVIKTEARRDEARKRIKEIENQLAGSKYGVAYTDGTERITQLNRSVENNLMKQVEYLTELFYSQLTITQEVMNGTADEKTMLNYLNRTVEPIISALVDEMKRKWITPTARTQGQTIMFFQDQFKLVPMSELSELADKLTRNKIATANEMRQKMGWEPADDPDADRLKNANIAESKDSGAEPPVPNETDEQTE